MGMEINLGKSGVNLSYAAAAGLALSVIVLLWRTVDLLWLTPKKLERRLREQGFKGNPYRPPLGDALLLFKLTKDALSKPISLSDDTLPRVLPFVLNILNKHGNNSFGWAATAPWLVVTDVAKIKEILIKYDDFRKPNHPITKLILVGLFGLEGEKWVKHRKIINPAFHLEKLKNMLPAMQLCCTSITDLWAERVSKEGSAELDVWPFLESLTADVISRAAFGSSYEKGRKIFDLQKEILSSSLEMMLLNYIPGLRYLPTKKNRRLKAINKEINALLIGMIEKRKMELERGGSNKDDLLGILLESNSREIEEHGNTKGGLTTEEVVHECKLFYIAGEETTSSLLSWTLVLLSKHQEWQEQARTEIFQVFGKDQSPNFEGLNQLKIVSMVLNEVLRLYSPGYMLLRKVFKDTKLGDWLIPAGTELIIPFSAIHQDYAIWGKDAKEFNPARFSGGVTNAMKGPGLFLPFSYGPRVCVGQNFAVLEAKIALMSILRLFSLHLSPSYVHAPHGVITLMPQHGVNLVLCKL